MNMENVTMIISVLFRNIAIGKFKVVPVTAPKKQLAQIGQKEGIKNISVGCVKVQYLYLDNFFLFLFPC